MTAVAARPPSTLYEVETLTDEALRDLLAYPETPAEPRLRANFIASIDGAVTLDGAGRKLGTPTDRRVFTRLREVADVILVGATTAGSKPYADLRVEADAQGWRLSHGLSPALRLVVVSSRGVIPPHLLTATVPPIVLVSASATSSARRALEAGGAVVCEMPEGQITSAAIRRALGDLGLNRVLVEGGPTLFSHLVAGDDIDELCLTTSPMMVAGPARRIAVTPAHVELGMRRRDVLLGDDGTVIVRWIRR
ncbi:deaminase-reductase domain-containing protein [Mycolicibacterium flavescens]|uniref:dihydrofolate reductase family protein n=1 Tax=Mycobacterium neumannii TaxID=2048551 RepID=UPI000B9405AC|nr:dihydrofolate reductase family protein [Mycobacterium neumannii]VEG38116.1 deaminase-reductase domain-containing protein [Mycolicibacterium flavescens]